MNEIILGGGLNTMREVADDIGISLGWCQTIITNVLDSEDCSKIA